MVKHFMVFFFKAKHAAEETGYKHVGPLESNHLKEEKWSWDKENILYDISSAHELQ